MKIGFCGCSYTYGEGVSINERFSSLIGDHLNVGVTNIAVRGASNSEIFEQALHLLNSVDILVVQWSSPGRGRWKIFPNYEYVSGNRDNHPWFIPRDRWRNFADVYRMIDNLYNQYYLLNKRINILEKFNKNRIFYINGLLPVNQILLTDTPVTNLVEESQEFKRFIEFDTQPDDVLRDRIESCRALLNIMQYNWVCKIPMTKIDVGTDGGHPGPKTHRQMADKVIEYING